MEAASARDLAGAAFGIAAAIAILAGSPALASVIVVACAAVAVGWIVWQDHTTFTIPDGGTAALALAGVAARLAFDGASTDTLVALGVDLALTGGLLWLVREGFYRLRGRDGLGFGDVKLAAASGLAVGATGFMAALLAASVAGICIALLRGARRTERLAFGALLAPAVLVTLAAQLLAADGFL